MLSLVLGLASIAANVSASTTTDMPPVPSSASPPVSPDPPVAAIERTTDDLVRVTIVGGVRVSGYNLYRDGDYVTTVRPPLGAAAFPARVGARGGVMCVVAFEESGGAIAYSRCGADVQVAAGTPESLDDELPGPPSMPPNLRAVVYSRGTVELFWNRARDEGRVVGYRVRRDSVELLDTPGRSLFESGLDPDTRYHYEVSAIDDEDNEGPAASLVLRAVPADVSPPPPPIEAGAPPAAPRNFRAVAYSPGVVEVFWDASPDESALAGYALARDGAPLAFIRGRSVFQTDLEPTRVYVYRLVAVGADGVRSAPLSLALRAAPEPLVEPERALTLDTGELALLEGDAEGVSVALHLWRPPGDARALSLSVVDESGAPLTDIEARFEPAVLAGEALSSRLTLSLPLSMAPRLPATRALMVRADDGEQAVSVPLVLDIEPTRAPDVYLLIGQSNMEGYSERGAKRAGLGEPDEPLERLRQLHVRANNPRFYPTPESYVGAEANFVEPRFIRAEDPLHDRLWPGQSGKSGDFIGASLTFGKAALADTVREVYLVPAAWGATGFCGVVQGDRAWNAAPSDEPALGGTLLLDRALLRLEVALRESGGILRGILWHQGGADSNEPRCSETYADNLVAMVERLRSEALADARGSAARGPRAPIPFIVATQSRGFDERGDFTFYNPLKSRVDAVHRDIARLVPYADVVINDDLVPPAYPCGQSSCVHFGSAALREQGVRFHAALQRVRARHVSHQ